MASNLCLSSLIPDGLIIGSTAENEGHEKSEVKRRPARRLTSTRS